MLELVYVIAFVVTPINIYKIYQDILQHLKSTQDMDVEESISMLLKKYDRDDKHPCNTLTEYIINELIKEHGSVTKGKGQ